MSIFNGATFVVLTHSRYIFSLISTGTFYTRDPVLASSVVPVYSTQYHIHVMDIHVKKCNSLLYKWTTLILAETYCMANADL